MPRTTKKPDLHLVAATEQAPPSPVTAQVEAAVYDLMRAPETTAERVKRLQAEAHALALEEVEAMNRLLSKAAEMAREISAGGDAYPVGARELASRLASDLPQKVETLRMILSRVE
jgi:type II secretory pathway predicted ATPase ExeA